MRGRMKPIFQDFNPEERSTLVALMERSQVLPPSWEGGGPAEAKAPEPGSSSAPQLHVFMDGEFQPTGTFLNLLRDEVASEMETLFDRADITQYPSMSDNFQLVLADAIVATRAGDAGDRPATAGAVAAGQGEAPGAAPMASGETGLQRKFVPPAPPVPPEVEGGAVDAAAQRRRLPLVMVASLVDKTPNLAGLCRTCEVFNCEAVCLANAKITKDQSFQSISVTAEKWLPIREVPRAGVGAYLLEQRKRGYSIIGIEQTHNSVPMDQFCFEPNTVFLLGAEKEGIDAELLPFLDACVEIPQAGQLRSLNVHVSGSLAVWEYTRQCRAAAAGREASH